MARTPIDYGTTPGDGTGDILFTSFKNTDDNFIDLYFNNIDNRVVVKQASQLDGVLDSSKVYVIDGVIDLGTIEITVPEGGLVIKGLDYFISGLKTTEDNHTMFKNDVASYAGNVKMESIFLTSSGTGSKLFDLDNEENFGAIEFQSCNLGDFSDSTTSLGEIANYRQFRTNDCGLFRLDDGLIFTGTWAGGFRVNDTIVLAQAASSVLFKVGAGLTFAGRCISDINAASVDPTTITFDFVETNFLLDGGFQLTGASFAPNSSISVTTDETSIKAFFRDCVEIRNTHIGFEMVWTSEVVTPLTLNTPAKGFGTTVTSNNTWFTQTGNNEITYDSSLTKDIKVTVPLVLDGGPNDEVSLHVERWDDSLSAYETIKTRTRLINNLQGGNDLGFYNVTAIINDMAQNDRIEMWLENISDSSDVTIQLDSEVIGEVL